MSKKGTYRSRGNPGSKKSKSKAAKVEPENQWTIHNVNLQIGDHNTLKVSEAISQISDHTDRQFSKNDVVVGFLHFLIKAEPQHIIEIDRLLSKFEKSFRTSHQESSTFHDIAGIPFRSFIDKNPGNFEKVKLGTKILIKSKIQTDTTHSKDDPVVLKIPSTEPQCRTNDSTAGMKSETDDTEVGYYTPSEPNFDFTSDDNANEPLNISLPHSTEIRHFSTEESDTADDRKYTVIKRKLRKRSSRSRGSLVSLENVDKTKGSAPIDKTDCDKNMSLLYNLLDKPESSDLHFCDSAEEYLQDNKEFMLDLTSLWNTPSRGTAYIVIGVKVRSHPPHELVGMQSSLQQSDFERLFKTDWCTGWPLYRYFEVKMDQQIIGVIEIKSSHGCGQPCILTFPPESSKDHRKDEMWIRNPTGRHLCHLRDPEAAMVFQWFVAAKTKVPTKPMAIQTTKSKSTNGSIESQTKKEGHQSSKEDLCSAVKGFKRGHFVLVAGNIPPGMPNAYAVSLVPWIAVYDFDISSRDDGLLNSNENILAKKRSLHISTWESSSKSMSESGTIWYFPRGERSIPESRIKDDKDVRNWFFKVKQGLDGTINQLQRFISDYTVLTIVIFWPQDEELAPFVSKFLNRIDDRIDPLPNIVMCLPHEPASSMGKSVYSALCDYYKKNMTVVRMELKDVCEEIQNIQKDIVLTTDVTYDLPLLKGQTTYIDETEAAWLREHLEVLYKTNTYSRQTVEDLHSEKEAFYKGATLHWFAWYECEAGHFDVERGIMRSIIGNIDRLVEENKSALFTLYHAPGSGGSTLAQRILWEFHLKIPCVHMKICTSSSVFDIIERIEMIYEKSQCPVLLLIDGEDETKVKNIFRTVKSRYTIAIIFYVKRCIKKIEFSVKQAWLKGSVTVDESKKLALKFGDHCNDQGKKGKLNALCNDVANQKPHYLYEFGLATYLHEFKGIESYVRGYLALHENKTKELTAAQVMLGYLSLVYYYGQTSLSCQFFASLLNMRSNADVSLADFPEVIEYFVVADDQDGRKMNIRICHYLIAKEILNQILGRYETDTYQRDSNTDLCNAARKNLYKFCLEFIEYASRKKTQASSAPHHIIHVLTRTFIFRDNRDMGENAEQVRKKPVLSKVMVDIKSSPPTFVERQMVLKKLTQAFPDDPNFHAHLGRFHAFCRPDEEHEVEICFQTALKLCEDKIKNRETSDIDDRLKMSIMHIYHMYGTVLQKRIARFTGQAPDDKPEKETNDGDFFEMMKDIISMAETACSYFVLCREYTPNGQDSCFGYVGEIMVRLQVCDYVKKHFSEGGHEGIYGFLSPGMKRNIPGRAFVKDSISTIDSLFMECYRFIEREDIDHSIQRAQFWYNHLFRGKSDYLEGLALGDDIFGHRLRIAARKLKYGTIAKRTDISLLEDVTSKEDIMEIVNTYEKIFQEISRVGIQGSKRFLDLDYIEWLYALRHPYFEKKYKLEDVHQTVLHWNDQLGSPMAKFYLFIVTSLLGFTGKTEYLVEAQVLNDELRKLVKYILKPKYPREWLGNNLEGIRRLVPGTRFLGLNIEDREMKVTHQNLDLCKGTICGSNNKRLSGFISLDLGDNTVPVRVYYIPHTANMASTQFANTRVEFYLAFSIGHGYEAFNVKRLQKYGCISKGCSAHIEITSQEEFASCPACHRTLHKDQLNVVGNSSVDSASNN